MLGVSLIDQELALAHVGIEAGQPALLLCECVDVASAHEAARVLTDKAHNLGLEQTACNFVLAPDDYSLLLVEAPNVEPAELAAAAKWKIKDMIDRPLDQLAVTVFPIPGDAYRSQREMLYVVAADRKKIQLVADMVTNAGLKLESIDIPELAMRNLTRLFADDGTGLATMDLRHDGSLLNLSKNGVIYLTRHLSTQIGNEILSSYEWDSVKDRLVLEIQRSLDYYESQMGQGHINRMLVAPRKQDADALRAQLDQAMGVKVDVMNLQGKLASNVELSNELQQRCLLAIGAALRTEKAA